MNILLVFQVVSSMARKSRNYDFKDYKNTVDSFALGINDNSGKTADYSPTSSFRLYTLKDKKHAMYEDDAAEQKSPL